MPATRTGRITPCSKPHTSQPGFPFLDSTRPKSTAFTYNAPTDDYTCAAGKRLSFRKYDTRADGTWQKIYWATCSDCQQCALKPTGVPGAKRKQLTRTIYDAA
jgi:hypothetical protein